VILRVVNYDRLVKAVRPSYLTITCRHAIQRRGRTRRDHPSGYIRLAPKLALKESNLIAVGRAEENSP